MSADGDENLLDVGGDQHLGDGDGDKRMRNCPQQEQVGTWQSYKKIKNKDEGELKTYLNAYVNRHKNRKWWLDQVEKFKDVEENAAEWKSRASEIIAWAVLNVPEQIELEAGSTYDPKKRVWKSFCEYKNYDLRKEARASESEALTKASAVLSGAKFN